MFSAFTYGAPGPQSLTSNLLNGLIQARPVDRISNEIHYE